MKYSPIIILGMHRSGTSLLSRILEKLGIFMGAKKEVNNESLFFLNFNEWLFRQANATWDNPYNYTLVKEDFKELMVKLSEKYLESFRRIEYLGFSKFIKYNSLKDLDFPWGWKDPRNSFTIDIWIKVFPSAKLIHIYRNPVDVAESLRKRTLSFKENFEFGFREKLKFVLRKGFLGFVDSVRVEHIYEGIKLWEEYVSHIFFMENKFNLKILHIKYEDFLQNPVDVMKDIMSFLGFDINKEKLKMLVSSIDSSRSYAFVKNRELIEVYENIKNNTLLKKLGYDSIL